MAASLIDVAFLPGICSAAGPETPEQKAERMGWVSLIKEVLDPNMTVLTLELEEPFKLYRGSGQVISYNK